MFVKQLFMTAVALVSAISPSLAAAPQHKTTRSIRPFTAEIVNFDTTLPFSTVIARLDAAINKTGSLNFVADFHASKTKLEQTTLIADIVQGRNFLYFMETNHKAWLDVYDPATKHPGAVVYMIGNPNFASQILPLDYTTGVNIPPRFLILEKPDGKGTNIIYQQFSKIFAPFDKNPELAGHTHDLDVNFNALFTGVTAV